MKVVDTEGWSFDRLSRYTREITAAMKKLADKFHHDCTVASLYVEIEAGRQKLWLILDDEDQFVSFAMTAETTVDATGWKLLTLTNMAGAEGLGIAADMCREIHAYADAIEADETRAVGSRAWLRELKKHGYSEYAVVMSRITDRGRAK